MLANEFSTQEQRMLQYYLPKDSLAFSRYFYKNSQKRKAMMSDHMRLMAKVKRRVFDGEIKRLIVNIPPGYLKTQYWVIDFIAEGLAINPQSLFMHLSYSQGLALFNSQQAKDIVESDEYQALWPMNIRSDSNSKQKWFTDQGGGVYATAAGGQVTGFRAGRLVGNLDDDPEIIEIRYDIDKTLEQIAKYENIGEEPPEFCVKRLKRKQILLKATIRKKKAKDNTLDHKFWGALIIDDPLKPDDAFSETTRDKINNRFNNTIKSRLASESDTPIILIMQRLHEEDLSNYLLTGKSGDKWHHLILPVEIPDKPVKEWYPKDYTHGIPIEYDLPPGPLWKAKHDVEQIRVLSQTDSYTSDSQYSQRPTKLGGELFKSHYWSYFDIDHPPTDITIARIYVDTAQKAKEHNDYTVFELWGYSPKFKGIFLLDLFRKKLTTPQIKKHLIGFWEKHKARYGISKINAQSVYIEDKNSGTGVIQELQEDTYIPVVPIPRELDKVTRALNALPYIASKRVYLPANAIFFIDFTTECSRFKPDMSHKHDDQIDPMLDAIDDLLIKRVNIYDGMV